MMVWESCPPPCGRKHSSLPITSRDHLLAGNTLPPFPFLSFIVCFATLPRMSASSPSNAPAQRSSAWITGSGVYRGPDCWPKLSEGPQGEQGGGSRNWQHLRVRPPFYAPAVRYPMEYGQGVVGVLILKEYYFFRPRSFMWYFLILKTICGLQTVVAFQYIILSPSRQWLVVGLGLT